MGKPSTVVCGDLHLTRQTPQAVVDDLVRLLRAHPGDEVVVAGDFFDLSTDAPRRERHRAIAEVLGAFPAVRAAIGEHVDRGGSLCFVGGNHDADLGRDDLRPGLLAAIEPSAAGRERLTTTPWFLRRGRLHIEHGHLYDPDNAPEHPLVVGQDSLGVHFSSAFIYPTGAYRYLQANDQTPLHLLLSAFRWYGVRGPYVVYRYFHAAFEALLQSGPLYRRSAEHEAGRAQHAEYAAAVGVTPDLLDELLELGAPSTLESTSRTLARLYMDRVLATFAIAGGLGAAAAGAPVAGGATALLGSMLMTVSWLQGHNRYRGTVTENLRAAAGRIATETGAELVVFGHTHREEMADGYANTGSFAFPGGAPGRPYLLLEGTDEHPLAVRRHLPTSR